MTDWKHLNFECVCNHGHAFIYSSTEISWSHWTLEKINHGKRGADAYLPSWWTRMAEAVMSVVTLKYGNHRSWWHRVYKVDYLTAVFLPTGFKHIRMNINMDRLCKPNTTWAAQGPSQTRTPGVRFFLSHLSLFVLKHLIDARVEGRTRKHGGDGIRQIQHSLENWIHCLRVHKTWSVCLFVFPIRLCLKRRSWS